MATRGPLKLGLEIEAVFVPKDLKQPLGIAQFADYLAEGYSGTPGLHSNYTPGSYNGPQYVEWEIIRDVSLRKDLTNMTHALEITSPILTFDEQGQWRQQVKDIFAHLQAKCERIETNKSCGFHVHLSPGDGFKWDLDELKRVCIAVLYFEDAFLALIPESRRHTSYVSNNRYDHEKFSALSFAEC
ncbi:hypothetical protein BR93DRAFT_939021 [Coniochaeta sp. PMI_546]|nr:hypothetical protein BR93DRAFT_939021 [Coniochaeta sp. PMI_546]